MAACPRPSRTGFGSDTLVFPWGPVSASTQHALLKGKTSLQASMGLEDLPSLFSCPTPLVGITVTGQIIGDKGSNPNSRTGKTYFGKLGITSAWMDFRIEVTTEKIMLGNGDALSTFSWLDTVTITQTG